MIHARTGIAFKSIILKGRKPDIKDYIVYD